MDLLPYAPWFSRRMNDRFRSTRNAIDGYANTYFSLGFHPLEDDVLIKMDEELTDIDSVWITARSDQDWDELSDVTVTLYYGYQRSKPPTRLYECARGVRALSQGQVVKVGCSGKPADTAFNSVRLTKPSIAQRTLGLAEVKVMRSGRAGCRKPGKCVPEHSVSTPQP